MCKHHWNEQSQGHKPLKCSFNLKTTWNLDYQMLRFVFFLTGWIFIFPLTAHSVRPSDVAAFATVPTHRHRSEQVTLRPQPQFYLFKKTLQRDTTWGGGLFICFIFSCSPELSTVTSRLEGKAWLWIFLTCLSLVLHTPKTSIRTPLYSLYLYYADITHRLW